MAKSLREELSSMKRKIRCIQCNESNSGIGGIQSIQAGENVSVDATDPLNPIVSATGGGSDQNNIPVVHTFTLDDIGATGEETQEELEQLIADYINGLNLVIAEDEIHYFQLIGDDSGGQPTETYIEVTKVELDTHIANSTLKPSTLYKITGVQPFLYGGTDIWLRAITTNSLEPKGTGKFYVPKYDKGNSRYGIYDGFVKVEVTDNSYPPNTIYYDSEVTTDNGAVGKWKSVSLIEYVSGDWDGATQMYVDGITFNITSVNTTNYNTNDTVIFGGKVWKNISGLRGNIIDIYNLSEDWGVIPFNSEDYNIENDEIGYDIDNDCINYRRDKSNNIVEFSYNWWDFFENNYMNGDMGNSFSNPIKSFQWGNHFDNNFGSGVMSNSIHNSLFECINSTLGQIYSNTLNNGHIYSNTLNNGHIYSNTLENNGQIYSNTLNNGQIYSNTLENNGQINSNTLENSGYIRLGLSNVIDNKSIHYLTVNNGDIGGVSGIDLSSATLVYADYTREVFKNSAGVTKIRYVDGLGTTVIADLTD